MNSDEGRYTPSPVAHTLSASAAVNPLREIHPWIPYFGFELLVSTVERMHSSVKAPHERCGSAVGFHSSTDAFLS